MKKEKDQNRKNKFNWKLVIISFIIIGIVYSALSIYLDKKNSSYYGLETKYCYFNKDIQKGSLPRNECGYLKIVSNIGEVDLESLKSEDVSVACSDSIKDLPKCEGSSFHFTQFPLESFCTTFPCNVTGFVCGAYFMEYYTNDDYDGGYRTQLEEGIFTQPNIKSERKLMKMLRKCNSGFEQNKSRGQ